MLVWMFMASVFFDLIISMFYFWPSEGLYNDPPFWLTNAWVYLFSTIFDEIRYLVVTYPAYALTISLFLLAPFYRIGLERLEKAWRKIQVEAYQFLNKVLTGFLS
jgi:hypothetical protein